MKIQLYSTCLRTRPATHFELACGYPITTAELRFLESVGYEFDLVFNR